MPSAAIDATVRSNPRSATRSQRIHGSPGVRTVQLGGRVSFQGHQLRLPKTFRGQRVAFRPTASDGRGDVVFMTRRPCTLDLRDPDVGP